MLPLTALLTILVTVHAGGHHVKGGHGSAHLEQKGLQDDHLDSLYNGEIPKPYNFDFETGGYVKTSRQESGDPSGHVQGVYSLSSPRGHSRVVEYTADDEGFHADIVSSEPGIKSHSPANVRYRATSQKLPFSHGAGPLSSISPLLQSSGIGAGRVIGQQYVSGDHGIDGGYFTDYGTRSAAVPAISQKFRQTLPPVQSRSSPAENPAQIFFSLGGSGVSGSPRSGSAGYKQTQAAYTSSGRLGGQSYGGQGIGADGGIGVGGIGGGLHSARKSISRTSPVKPGAGGSYGGIGGGGPANIHFTIGGVDASTYGSGGAGLGGQRVSGIGGVGGHGVGGVSGVRGTGVGGVSGSGIQSSRKFIARTSPVKPGAEGSYGGVGGGGPANIHFTLGGVDASTYGSGGAGLGIGGASYLDSGLAGPSAVGEAGFTGVRGTGLHTARKSISRTSAVSTGGAGSYGGVSEGGPAKIHFTLGGVDASTYGSAGAGVAGIGGLATGIGGAGAGVGGGRRSYGVKQSQTSYLDAGLSGPSRIGAAGLGGVGAVGLHSARKTIPRTSAVKSEAAISRSTVGEGGPNIQFTLGGVDASTYGSGRVGTGVGGGRSSYGVKQSQTSYLDSGLSGQSGLGGAGIGGISGGLGGVGLHSARKTISRTSAVQRGAAGSYGGMGESGPAQIQFILGGVDASTYGSREIGAGIDGLGAGVGGAGAVVGVGGGRGSYGVKQSQTSYLDSGLSGQTGIGGAGIGGIGGAGLHSARKTITRTSAVKTGAAGTYGGIGESGPAKIHFTLGGVDASTYGSRVAGVGSAGAGVGGVGAGVGGGRRSYGVKQPQTSYLDSGISGHSGVGRLGVGGIGGVGLHSARKTISRTSAIKTGTSGSYRGVGESGPAQIHFTLGGIDASTYGSGGAGAGVGAAGAGVGVGGGRSSYGIKQSQTSYLDSGLYGQSGIGGAGIGGIGGVGLHSARKTITRTSAVKTGAAGTYGGIGESGPAKIHFTLGGVDASTYGSGAAGVGAVGAGGGGVGDGFGGAGYGVGVAGGKRSYGVKQSQRSYLDSGISGHSGVGRAGIGGVGVGGLHSARKTISRTSAVKTGAAGSYRGVGDSGPAQIHFTLGGSGGVGAGVGGRRSSYGVKQSQTSYLDSGLTGVGGVGTEGIGGGALHSARKTVSSSIKSGVDSYGGTGEGAPNIQFTIGGIDASTYGSGAAGAGVSGLGAGVGGAGVGVGVGGGRSSYGVKQSQTSYLDSELSGPSGIGAAGIRGIGGAGLHSARKTVARTSAVKTGAAGTYSGRGESGPAQIHFTLGGVDASTYGSGGVGAGVGGRRSSYGVKQSQTSYLDSGLSGPSGIGGAGIGGVRGASLHSARKTITRTSGVKTGATGTYGGIGESGPAKIHFTLGGVDASTYGSGAAGAGFGGAVAGVGGAGAGVGGVGGRRSYGVKQTQASYLDSGLYDPSGVGGVGGMRGVGLQSAVSRSAIGEGGPSIQFTLGGVDASTYGSGGAGAGVGGGGSSYGVKQSHISYLDSGVSGPSGIGGVGGAGLHSARKTIARTSPVKTGGAGSYDGVGGSGPAQIHFTLGGIDASTYGSGGAGAGLGGGRTSYGIKQSQTSYLKSGLGGAGISGVGGAGVHSTRSSIGRPSGVKSATAGYYGGVKEYGPAKIHFTLGGVDASTYGSGGSGYGVGSSGGYNVQHSKTAYRASGLSGGVGSGIHGVSAPLLHTAHKRTVSGIKGGPVSQSRISDEAPSKIHFTLGGVDASTPGSSGYGSYESLPTSPVVKGGSGAFSGAPLLSGGFSPVSSISPKAYVSQTRQTVIASSTGTGFQGQRAIGDVFSGSSPLHSDVQQAQVEDVSFAGQGSLPGRVRGVPHGMAFRSGGAVRPVGSVTKISQETVQERYTGPGHIQFTLGGNQIFPGTRYSGSTIGQRRPSSGVGYLSQTPVGSGLGGGHQGQVQLKVGDRASDFGPAPISQLNVPVSQLRDSSRDSYAPSKQAAPAAIQFTLGDQQAPLSSRRSASVGRYQVPKVSQFVSQAEDLSVPSYGAKLSQSRISYDSGLGHLGDPSAGHHVISKHKPSHSSMYAPRLSYVAQYPYDAPDDFRPSAVSKHLGGGIGHGDADIHRSSSASLGHQGSGVQQVILADHAIFNSKGSEPSVHEHIAQERL